MARQVRMGLIGCGKIAKTHAAALASLPESAFSACCDMDVARAEAMAEEHGVPNVFGDVQEMLHSGKVDAVCVCTPHPSHAPVVVAAAEAGVHVICEKPLTIDLGEADRMVTAAEQAGIKFAGIFQRRFWPASQKIRQAIDSGKLGKLTLGECAVHIWRPEAYYKSDPWRGKWATEGGGVLMNQAVHAIDLFQWYMGPVAEVTGRIATLKHGDYIDVEDTAVATVVFQSGALGVIHAASTANPPLGFRVTVLGDNGATASVWEQPEGSEGMTDLWTVPGEEAYLSVWTEPERGPGFPGFHALQIQDFLQAILEDRAPAVTGAESRKSLAIILAIYESSRTGQAVKFPAA
ncbi:MAG: Gfo/Idh/MocA family protein [Thermomicrobiales bacterium]